MRIALQLAFDEAAFVNCDGLRVGLETDSCAKALAHKHPTRTSGAIPSNLRHRIRPPMGILCC